MDAPASIEVLLTQVTLFKGVPPSELAELSRATRKIYARKGDILFRKNDLCTGFHAILQGQVKLTVCSLQGSEKVVKILTEGASFGEAAMLMDQPHSVFAEALSDSLLLHVGKDALFAQLERNHHLCRRMLSGMALREHDLMADVESYALHSGTQRVISYLMRNVSHEDLGDDNIVVTLPTNKGVIASRLSLTQEHFSRILHDLINLELIVVEGRGIHIPSVMKLQEHGA